MRYQGIVQKGERRGSALGFPTINILLDGEHPAGIFAARVSVDGAVYKAAAYVNTSRGVLEAHLLDFSVDIYGREVTIELLQQIRDDKKFESEAELKEAISSDVKAVRQYFNL